MSIAIPRQKLVNALSKIVAIVEKRSTMPILEHVKIEVRGDDVSLTTTDMDAIARTNFTLEPQETAGTADLGFTTVAQTLHDIARKMFNCQDIIFDTGQLDRSIIVKSNSNQFVLPCLDVSSFPSFDQVQPQSSFQLKVEDFLLLLRQTRHAMSNGDSRYYLNGLHLHLEEGKLVAVATDIHRMALMQITAPAGFSDEVSVIVPRKAVIEMHKILEDYAGDDWLKVDVSQHKIGFTLHDLVLTSKLIDAKFPNYKAAIPQGKQSRTRVEVGDLIKAIDLVTTIAEGKIKSVRLLVSKDKICISVDNQIGHRSSGVQEVDAVSEESERDIEVIVNSRYILDVLSVIKGGQVEVLISNSISPIVLKDSGDERGLYVLMPMQFGSGA